MVLRVVREVERGLAVGLETGWAGDVGLVDTAKKLAEVDDFLRGLGESDDLCLRRGERDALLLGRSPFERESRTGVEPRWGCRALELGSYKDIKGPAAEHKPRMKTRTEHAHA